MGRLEIEALRRRRDGEPENRSLAFELARALARTGECAEAYLLLFDQTPGASNDHALLDQLGSRLAEEQAPALRALLGTGSAVAVRCERGAWDWITPEEGLDARRPALALRLGLELEARSIQGLLPLRALLHLDLNTVEIQTAELARLTALRYLRELDLSGCFYPEAADPSMIASYMRVLQLRYEVRVLGEELSPLAWLPELSELRFDGIGLAAAGFTALAAIPKLSALTLSYARFEAPNLKALVGHPRLAFLGFSGSELDDAGLAHVAGCRALRELDLSDTAISLEGLRLLSALPHLCSLDLTRTGIRESEARAALPEIQNVDA